MDEGQGWGFAIGGVIADIVIFSVNFVVILFILFVIAPIALPFRVHHYFVHGRGW